MTNMTEEQFLKNYDLRNYPAIGASVDLTIFTIRNSKLSILLIQRGGHPHLEKWALPGGFIDAKETLDEAAARELQEETGLTVEHGFLEQLKTYGNPDRDPRGYIISTAYVALVPHANQPTAGDDATNARFYPVEDVLAEGFELAFDHKTIIEDGLERVRAKLEYTPTAHYFLDDNTFTLSELRKVYEIVWGVELIPSNFRRKMMTVEGLLVPANLKKTSNIAGGRTAELFMAGDATEIFPPYKQPR